MSTLSRFQKYIKLEEMVAEKVRLLADLGGTITRITQCEDGLTYDRIVIMESGTHIKLEIQITEAWAWEKYGDVRLDLLSAFQHKPGSRYAASRGVAPQDCGDFLKSVRVQRYGKLFVSEADVFAFYVTEPVDLLWIFRMTPLQEARSYFMQNYGIRINRKSEGENWQSCFVPVHKTDHVLDVNGVIY